MKLGCVLDDGWSYGVRWRRWKGESQESLKWTPPAPAIIIGLSSKGHYITMSLCYAGFHKEVLDLIIVYCPNGN